MSFEEIVDDIIKDLFGPGGSTSSEANGGFSEPAVPDVAQGNCSGPDFNVLAPWVGRPDRCDKSSLVRHIKSQELRKSVLRHLIKCGTNEEALQVSGELCRTIARDRTSRGPSFIAIVPHLCTQPHVHFWHDCNPSNGNCRCRILLPYRKKEEPFVATRENIRGFRSLRSIPSEEARKVGDPYIERLLRYIVLRQGKGQNEKGSVFVQGKRWELSTSVPETGALPARPASPDAGNQICYSYEEVDSARELFIGGGVKRPAEDCESLELPTMGYKRQPGEKKGFEPTRIAKSKVSYIENMLDTYIYTPPNILCQSSYWVNDNETRFISASSPEFQLAIHNVQTRFSQMSYQGFLDFYRKQRHYIFRPGVVYWDVQKSFYYARQWIEEQSENGTVTVPAPFGVTREKKSPKEWLQMISNIVNRRERKRFALILQGPTSCGKTWFTNMLLDFYLNKGELNNWNKYENTSFPFMGLVNRRIALWNEALLNGDASQKENLKVLFEGESKCVSVKNQKDGTVISTPIVVTTNNLMFEKDLQFKERQTVLTVAKVPMLTGGTTCPGFNSLHPFAWPKLLEYYKIETEQISENDVSNNMYAPQIMSLEQFVSFETSFITLEQ